MIEKPCWPPANADGHEIRNKRPITAEQTARPRSVATQGDELHAVDDWLGAAKRVPLAGLDVRRITRAPAENSEPFASSTTPAPSDPRTRGAFARGYPPDRMVCSSGVTPAAVIFTSTPSVRNVRLGNVRQLQILVAPESFRSHCAHDFQFLPIQKCWKI